MPFPEDLGLLVGPGFETSIGLTMVFFIYHWRSKGVLDVRNHSLVLE